LQINLHFLEVLPNSSHERLQERDGCLRQRLVHFCTSRYFMQASVVLVVNVVVDGAVVASQREMQLAVSRASQLADPKHLRLARSPQRSGLHKQNLRHLASCCRRQSRLAEPTPQIKKACDSHPRLAQLNAVHLALQSSK